MGRNDAIQIIRRAIEELSDKNQTAGKEKNINQAGDYGESAQTLGWFMDGLTSTKGEGIRLT